MAAKVDIRVKLHNWNLRDEIHHKNAPIFWREGIEGLDWAYQWRLPEMAALYPMQVQLDR